MLFMVLNQLCFGFILISVPKSGTTFLKEILAKATGLQSTFPSTISTDNCFGVCHTRHYMLPYEKYILLVRDPRDILLSYSSYLTKQIKGEQNYNDSLHEPFHFLSLNETEKIQFLLQFDNQFELKYDFMRLEEHLYNSTNNPNVLVLRYEDIIGPKGGGSLKSQRRSFATLIDYLRLDTNVDHMIFLAEQIYGKTWTFNKGKQKAWKKAFSRELHQQILESPYGKLLEPLGYSPIYE